MIKFTGWLTLLLTVCSGLVFFQRTANAEFYVAGQLGPQISNNFGNVGTTGGPTGVRFSDVDLNNSLALGAKAGYFFP